MLGHFGFSYVGLVYLLLLSVPNLLWVRKQANQSPGKENRFLLLCERIGQASVTCVVLIFDDFNLSPFTPWSGWLILSFLLMLLYEACWVRYFRTPSLASFYAPLWRIPVPLATLPVTAFLLLGIYGRVGLLIAAVLLLGIGHIGIHWQHAKECGMLAKRA